MGPIRRWLWSAAILTVAISALAGWATWRMAFARALDETARRGDNVLQLAISTLEGQLERFERLPPLIADQPVVQALAADPGNPGLVAITNAYLQRIQRQLGATDVYMMDAEGLTIAASNHDQTPTFIGGNFAFRPYFTEAIPGGRGGSTRWAPPARSAATISGLRSRPGGASPGCWCSRSTSMSSRTPGAADIMQ